MAWWHILVSRSVFHILYSKSLIARGHQLVVVLIFKRKQNALWFSLKNRIVCDLLNTLGEPSNMQ